MHLFIDIYRYIYILLFIEGVCNNILCVCFGKTTDAIELWNCFISCDSHVEE